MIHEQEGMAEHTSLLRPMNQTPELRGLMCGHFDRKRELKRCARPRVGARPQTATVRFDNRPANSQSHTSALRFGRTLLRRAEGGCESEYRRLLCHTNNILMCLLSAAAKQAKIWPGRWRKPAGARL